MFTEYFSLTPLLSFHHKLHHLHDFLHLKVAPYIPPKRLHMKLVSMPVFKWPDTVDVTDQDCLTTLRDTRCVCNSACYPSPCPSITSCLPTYLIPTEIKFGVICQKIDVVNKESPYVIKFVALIVTILSFLCCCVVVADIFESFYLYPAPIVHTLCNVIVVFSTHMSAEINCTTGYTP